MHTAHGHKGFNCPTIGLKRNSLPRTFQATLKAVILSLVDQASYGEMLHLGKNPEAPTKNCPSLSIMMQVAFLMSLIPNEILAIYGIYFIKHMFHSKTFLGRSPNLFRIPIKPISVILRSNRVILRIVNPLPPPSCNIRTV